MTGEPVEAAFDAETAVARRAVSSLTVYARLTDSGASWRVNRFRSTRVSSQAPSQGAPATDEVVEHDPQPSDTGHLGQQRPGRPRLEVVDEQ